MPTAHIVVTMAIAPQTYYIGQPVTFTYVSAPGGIVSNAIYYVVNPVISLGALSFNIATSFANALVGTLVAYTTAGTTVVGNLQTTGAKIGEQDHILSVAELATHTHPPLAPFTTFVNNGPASSTNNFANSAAFLKDTAATTGPQGNNAPHNTIQLSTLYNIYMKL